MNYYNQYRLTVDPQLSKFYNIPFTTICRESITNIYRYNYTKGELGKLSLNIVGWRVKEQQLDLFCGFLQNHFLKSSLVVPFNGNGISVYKTLPEPPVVSLLAVLLRYFTQGYKGIYNLEDVMNDLFSERIHVLTWDYTVHLYTVFYAYLCSQSTKTLSRKSGKAVNTNGPYKFIRSYPMTSTMVKQAKMFAVDYLEQCYTLLREIRGPYYSYDYNSFQKVMAITLQENSDYDLFS